MTAAGIIAEYNPFHLGHAWHIRQTRAALGEDLAVVCVMSGHWTQGADCAIVPKWLRASLALQGGADLVLELPTPWAMSSAESFARGGVALLHATGVVEYLSFGSESGTLEPLLQAVEALESPQYTQRLRQGLEQGLSFPAARQMATQSPCLSSPNNNLGVEYLRALAALHSSMKPFTIPRRGVEHHAQEAAEGFASATYIRRLLRSNQQKQAEGLLPPNTTGQLEQVSSLYHGERAILARLRTMTAADWAALPDSGSSEGLPDRLREAARQALTLDGFYALAKTKRYTHARLRRLALSAFLGITLADRPPLPPYIRVLGFNRRGQELLKQMKHTCSLPILTKPAHAKALDGPARRLFEGECRYTDLYGLCFPAPLPCGLEWTTNPVRLES